MIVRHQKESVQACMAKLTGAGETVPLACTRHLMKVLLPVTGPRIMLQTTMQLQIQEFLHAPAALQTGVHDCARVVLTLMFFGFEHAEKLPTASGALRPSLTHHLLSAHCK